MALWYESRKKKKCENPLGSSNTLQDDASLCLLVQLPAQPNRPTIPQQQASPPPTTDTSTYLVSVLPVIASTTWQSELTASRPAVRDWFTAFTSGCAPPADVEGGVSRFSSRVNSSRTRHALARSHSTGTFTCTESVSQSLPPASVSHAHRC